MAVWNKSARNYRKGKLPMAELALFCRETGVILKSGIPLAEGMQLLVTEGTYRYLKDPVKLMASYTDQGRSFSEAMENSGVFPDYLLQMVKTGEITGNLDSVMEYLSNFYEKRDLLQRKIRSAVTYPLILSVLMAGVILLLIFRVLPMFNEILESLGGEVPQSARIITRGGMFLKQHLLLVLGGLLGIVLLAGVYAATPAGKRTMDRAKLKLPGLRRIYARILSARIGLGMSIVLGSGLGPEKAMAMVEGITGNSYVDALVRKGGDRVGSGEKLENVFAGMNLFPGLFIRMVALGNRTGELDQMLRKIADIYETEVDGMLQKITSAIEPLLVVVLSGVIGIILLAVMLPLIGIMSSIG